jgi:hypothetical protein
MRLIVRTRVLHLGVVALALGAVSCGGGSSAPSGPSATPTPIAQPTPTPVPSPTPTPDPFADLPAGPVTQVKAYLKTVESSKGSREYRNVERDSEGLWILYVGEYVVIDSTQRNGAGQICRWIKDPVYSYDNDRDMMDVKGSSEPFFFKFEVARTGYAEVTSLIDGIESNPVQMRAVLRPD